MARNPRETTKHDHQPAIMFYVDDWLESSDLKLVSLAAQGLWIHFICRMWKSPERGYLLKANGKQPQAAEIAKWTGATEAEIKQLVSELEDEQVSSTLEDGTIYCRRMVRSAKQTLSKSKAGKLGGIASGRSRKRSKTAPPISSSSSSSTLPAKLGDSLPAPAAEKDAPKERGMWGELEEKIGKAKADFIRATKPEGKVLSAWEWTKAQSKAGKMTGSYLACLRWALDNDKTAKGPAGIHKSNRRCPFCKYGTTDQGDPCDRCDGHGMVKGVTATEYKAMCEEVVGYLGKHGTAMLPEADKLTEEEIANLPEREPLEINTIPNEPPPSLAKLDKPKQDKLPELV